MLRNLTKSQIDERVKAINLSPQGIARLAGVHAATVYRGPKGLASHDRVTRALVAEEKRLLRHLLELHGVPAADEVAA